MSHHTLFENAKNAVENHQKNIIITEAFRNKTKLYRGYENLLWFICGGLYTVLFQLMMDFLTSIILLYKT